MNEKRIIKECTSKAPAWSEIVDYYRARPGLVEWLSNRHPVMRGEITDTPAPDQIVVKDEEAAA